MCPVDKFQPFSFRDEDDIVFPHDVSATYGMDPDLVSFPGAGHSPSIKNGIPFQIPVQHLCDDLCHPDGSATGRIFLLIVMGLHNLDLIIVSQDLRNIGQHLEEHVDPYAHIGGKDARDSTREGADRLHFGCREPGRSNYHGLSPFCGLSQMSHRRLMV